jgi:hypothetical protein
MATAPILVWHSAAWASYGIYVGKNLTVTAAYLAGYGDEPSSHWLEIVPRRDYPPGTSIVGAQRSRATQEC